MCVVIAIINAIIITANAIVVVVVVISGVIVIFAICQCYQNDVITIVMFVCPATYHFICIKQCKIAKKK